MALKIFVSIGVIIYVATADGRDNKKQLDKIQKRLKYLEAKKQSAKQFDSQQESMQGDSAEEVEQWIQEQTRLEEQEGLQK